MIIIGGSAGSFDVILSILNGLYRQISVPIVIISHRLKNAKSSFDGVLQKHTHYIVKEIEDKEIIKNGKLHAVPSNYHLLLETNNSFSLDVSELVNYSRPSIDVSFESFSTVVKENAAAYYSSRSNNDGSNGLKYIAENKGIGIITRL